ncbi:hypothetical protein AB0M02_10785 [Actinoplanes sp. NPDC051861]|uniref:hypothetical protein n=1 Tax=Actinoplanes sp. NPDC051861 TaxID=3155170 RepID=UPI0034321685
MPADSVTPAGTPNSVDLLAEVNDLCEAYAKARVARVLAEHSADHAEHERHATLADYWERESRARYDALVDTIETVAPRSVQIEEFLPVRTLPNGYVEVHARDQRARPVVAIFTGAEAVSVALHLTAHAAIGLDRTGAKVDPLLPALAPQSVTATGRAAVPSPR